MESARAVAVLYARLSRSFSFYVFFLMGRFHFVPHAVPPHSRFAKASGSPQVHRFCGYWSAHLFLRRRRLIPLKNVVKRMSRETDSLVPRLRDLSLPAAVSSSQPRFVLILASNGSPHNVAALSRPPLN